MKIWKPSQAVAFATIVALSILSTSSAEQCSNDSSFEYRDDPAKDCNWVAKNKEVRCSQKWKGMELETFCPASCNICPDTRQCSDDPTFKFRNQAAKDCEWVGKSAKKRCALKWKRIELSKYCPKACNACPVSGCEDDETIRFRNKAKRDCNWVSKRSTTRCSLKWLGKTLREHCPEACDACHTDPPTKFPTPSPTNYPSGFPTLSPTYYPSEFPTLSPTSSPSEFPTLSPTNYPSGFPTLSPTHSPSEFPTVSSSPTSAPSTIPSSGPTSEPTTFAPTTFPTQPPTDLPSEFPTLSPTHSPSGFPTALPSHSPTGLPSLSPTGFPSGFPSLPPSNVPSEVPSLSPTNLPSGSPTASPSNSPTGAPTTTFSPTGFPTQQPTFLPT